ncbi:hypothetical protein HGRIS_011593 [Hohenbuehelia grisea]|uniref:Uncharacterized protein n=1 Tax=Hohenbuehelia grisea TaxID=104357 RepID=A0ABR3JVL0_9AGAR
MPFSESENGHQLVWHALLRFAPNLKRLRLRRKDEGSVTCQDTFTLFGEYQLISENMQSLEELCLSVNGINDHQFLGNMLQSSASYLRALYLEAPISLDDASIARLVIVAKELAGVLPKLNLVVWPGTCAVRVRGEGHMGEQLTEHSQVQLPKWACPGCHCVGEWWEVDPSQPPLLRAKRVKEHELEEEE